MPFQNEPIAAMVAGCCSPLQYLEGAAYIAIVLAVLGVPQLLTHYLDQRNRRKERREDLAEAERIRREERAETERVRREERADAERRHQETLAALMAAITAMTAIVERNGHTPPEQTAVSRNCGSASTRWKPKTPACAPATAKTRLSLMPPARQSRILVYNNAVAAEGWQSGRMRRS